MAPKNIKKSLKKTTKGSSSVLSIITKNIHKTKVEHINSFTLSPVNSKEEYSLGLSITLASMDKETIFPFAQDVEHLLFQQELDLNYLFEKNCSITIWLTIRKEYITLLNRV